MFATLLLSLLSIASPAAEAAGQDELSFSWGSLGAPDEGWALFSDRDRLDSVGLRGGYGITPALSAVAGWQYAFDGGDLWTWDGEDDGAAAVALTTHRFTLGPKARYELLPWLVPYATVQGALIWGRARLDDDLSDDENLNQLRAGGVAPGALGALGLDLVAFSTDRPVRPAFGVELGYGWVAPLALDPLGELEFRGFYANWSLGARF